ncbi:MAG TPA: cobalamin-independent methionine synthase II family protein [Xanthobacteraceae bacterium]|nr:cobalamin-independent methionine synthase II family protein [Xanthobacteraceae bacterium]
MYRGTKDIMLPTTITGSLPRPSWYTENLGTRHFLEAMVSRRFREQYEDALTCYLRDQELAGLDICTDGDCRFDDDVGGQSWTAYPPNHMSGLDALHPEATPAGRGGIMFPRGHILHDYLESRVMPVISGPIGRGNLQYTAMWRAAQRFTTRPVKFGAVSAEIVAFALQDHHYKSIPDRIFAIADAFNEEYHELADAGCPVIQIEEPQIHLIAIRKIQDKVITPQLMVEVFNRTVKGLRAKTEVWAHSCWGNPSQQRMFAQVQSYKPALETYNTVDADVITFESSSSGGIDLEAIGKAITAKKIAIGVIDHHVLQVETPDEVAEKIRAALKHIPPERLVISTDCGMGREGMSRRHAFYKMVSLVLGTNMVRKELGYPLAQCLAADERYSLVMPAK